MYNNPCKTHAYLFQLGVFNVSFSKHNSFYHCLLITIFGTYIKFVQAGQRHNYYT